MLYILLIIIAIGVLFGREAGQGCLWLLIKLFFLVCLVYLGFWIVVIVIGLLLDKNTRNLLLIVISGAVFVICFTVLVYKFFKVSFARKKQKMDMEIAQNKTKKILIFEAEGLIRKLHQTHLEQHGFIVKTYEYPPKNLVEEVANENPDLIHMDILMRDMDGFSATRLLKSDSRTKDIPIFGMSNLFGIDKKDIEEAQEVGMENCLVTANTDSEEYVQRVKQYLNVRDIKKE